MAKDIRKAISCLDGNGLPKVLREYLHEKGDNCLWIICGNEYQQMELGKDNKVHPKGEILQIKESIDDMLLHLAEKKPKKYVGIVLRAGDSVDSVCLELGGLEKKTTINHGGTVFAYYGFKPEGININEETPTPQYTGNHWRTYAKLNGQ
ncbi:MAG: hypothetical protein KC589_11100 [Nanoarchaeota archaeon]|nr:hypothetical protein [Nanoarchaeota archaeon]